MKIRPVLTYGAPVLREKASPVEKVDEGIRRLIEEMTASLQYHQGAGLAAPQVGEPLRLFLAHDREEFRVFINPEILEKEGSVKSEEGCLSLPGIYVDIERAARVRVRYLDGEGRPGELWAENLLARIVQHENDHLDGVLICDRAGFLARKLIANKLHRLERENILL